MTKGLQSLTVVCHQVQGPDNLGSIARLIANFEVGKLNLSDPQIADLHDAKKMAVRGTQVLDSMEVFPTLREALQNCTYACGTTSRTDIRNREVLSPPAAAKRLLEASRYGPVALVLGGEKRGLSDDDLALCHDVLAISTGQVQPSMNLAQAAAVLLYECSMVSHREGQVTSNRDEPAAPMALANLLEQKMKEALLAVEFLNAAAPQYILQEMLRALWRGQPTRREAELWLGAFEHLRRVLKNALHPPKT